MHRPTIIRAFVGALLIAGGASSAWALPQIDCTEGVLLGTDAEAVLISLDDTVERVGEGGIPVDEFCAENPGLVGYVLPVPKPNDTFPDDPPFPEPPAPDGPGAMGPSGPARTLSARGFELNAKREPVPGDVEGEGGADPVDDDEAEAPAAEPAPSPAVSADEPAPTPASPGPEPALAGGCDAASSHSIHGLWGLLLALALRRRGGAR